jgi:hypothetical protein
MLRGAHVSLMAVRNGDVALMPRAHVRALYYKSCMFMIISSNYVFLNSRNLGREERKRGG